MGNHPKATHKLMLMKPMIKIERDAGILKFRVKNNVGNINKARIIELAKICPAKVGIPSCVANCVGKSIKLIASLIELFFPLVSLLIIDLCFSQKKRENWV